MYARGKRLKELWDKGLIYQKKNEIMEANVYIVGDITNNQIYDFVFVTGPVRTNRKCTGSNQIYSM